ncbi:MAG: hypothetical protein AB7P34_13535 [Vicinamibacterales bacterium]
MEHVGLLAVTAMVLIASIAAIRRDPRITARELRVQGALLAAYVVVAAGIGWLALSHPDDVAWLAAGGAALLVWLLVALPLLARYLGRRLGKSGR